MSFKIIFQVFSSHITYGPLSETRTLKSDLFSYQLHMSCVSERERERNVQDAGRNVKCFGCVRRIDEIWD